MTGSTLVGGSIRILWDASDSAEVTITGGAASFFVNGVAVTFPYTLASSTTFTTQHAGDYTVSVQHHGYEVANTPDGTRQVTLRFGEEAIFAPSPDGTPSSGFLANLSEVMDGRIDALGATEVWLPATAWTGALGDGGVLAKYGSRFLGWLLSDAVNEQCMTTLHIPSGWDMWDMDVWYGNPSAATGAVRFQINHSDKGDGADTTTLDTAKSIFTATAPAQNYLKVARLLSAMQTARDSLTQLRVVRIGADSNDTLAGDVSVLGAMLRRVEFGQALDLRRLRIGRLADSSTLVTGPPEYYEQVAMTNLSSYSDTPSGVNGQMLSALVSVEANSPSAVDQLPTWTAAETQHVGIMVGYQSVSDNYVLMISQAANQLQLVKQVANVETVLAKRSLAGKATLALGTKYRLELRATGAQVTGTIKTEAGVLIDTVTVADSSWSSGGIGFHAYAGRGRLHEWHIEA